MLDLYRSFENSIGYLLGTFPPAQIGEFETTNLEVEFLISLLASLSLSLPPSDTYNIGKASKIGLEGL